MTGDLYPRLDRHRSDPEASDCADRIRPARDRRPLAGRVGRQRNPTSQGTASDFTLCACSSSDACQSPGPFFVVTECRPRGRIGRPCDRRAASRGPNRHPDDEMRSPMACRTGPVHPSPDNKRVLYRSRSRTVTVPDRGPHRTRHVRSDRPRGGFPLPGGGSAPHGGRSPARAESPGPNHPRRSRPRAPAPAASAGTGRAPRRRARRPARAHPGCRAKRDCSA